MILRIFSDINCLESKMNNNTFFGCLIREEIISGLKKRAFETFQNELDINWVGLLVNSNEVNKYLSPKMNYIYNYLENISDYSFKPQEENKNIYINIIHLMIENLLNSIFEGRLEELFSESILDIKYIDKESPIKINNILYFTNLPEIIKIKINDEQNKKIKSFYKKFEDLIKSINNIYNKNKNIYEDFKNAIETDIKEEKQKRIENNFIKKKNELLTECNDMEGKINGYIGALKNIKENKLSFEDFNNEIKNIKSAKEYIVKKNKKYFTKEEFYKCISIKFKDDYKKCIIIYGENEHELNDIKCNSIYYLNINSRNIKNVIIKKNIRERNQKI